MQANLQGLDWPTIRVDHHYTGRLVSDLCVVSSVGVRLNTYEHVLSAECSEISIAGFEEIPILC